MEIIRGLHNLTKHPGGCVATIGNFDGVHLGHQAILKKLLSQSRQLNLPSVVISFDPQPQEYFSGTSFIRLSRFRDKAEILDELGIDRFLVIYFNQSFSQISADDFVDRLLVEQLGIKYLLIGDDFRYGQQRRGNFMHLQSKADRHQFQLEAIATIHHDRQRVSSTRIRTLLEQGDVGTAAQLLNRPYSISGHVQHGNKKGRTIGFPTANIPLHRNTPALRGVYAVRLWKQQRHQVYNGVANIGYKPTVGGQKALLEVHIFEFDEDIYSQLVHVDFIYKIRDEKKFDSFELLKQQILKDAEIARNFLKNNPNPFI